MISNTVSNALILSFLLFLSVECVLSQTLDDEIAALPACSTTCLSKAATNVKCATGDFNCQCQFQESIIGILGRVSNQATCLIGDCGISNTTTTRVTFKRICSLLSASSSSTSASVAPVASTVQSTSSLDQVLAPSTSTTETVTSSSTSENIPSTIVSVLQTSVVLQTTISSQILFSISVPASATSTTIAVSSSSTLTPATTSSSSTLVQSSMEPKPTALPMSVSDASSATSSLTSTPILTTSYTSAIMGAAKMSPIAETDSWNPIQAGETTPVAPLRQTRQQLDVRAIVGIVIGAVVIVVGILGVSFCCWRRRKMRSASGRNFVAAEEKAGPSSGVRSDVYQMPEPAWENGRDKSLPPHPVSPKTPDIEESSFEGRESSLTLNFEYSPPSKDRSAVTSRLQPTIYNPSQSSSMSPEPSSSIGRSDRERYRSTTSSFVPSNTAHKSAASSFFASIPILLDSKEGRCEDCLNNQEKYRFARSSGKLSPPVCTCAVKHPNHASHASHPSPTLRDESRGVSGLSITRSEVEEELLVGRVPTLMSDRDRNSVTESRDSEWIDELTLEKELSKISEESDAKPLRSNPVILPPRPLFSRKPSSKDSFDFGFKSWRRS